MERENIVNQAQTGLKQEPSNLRDHLSIVLLEDDVDLLTTITRMLVGSGFSVGAFQLAEHAMAALTSSRRIDLVIADLVLPGMKGREFCSKVAELRPGTPFIAMTGSDTSMNLAHFPANTTAIYKPFRRQEMMCLVLSKLGLAELPNATSGSHG